MSLPKSVYHVRRFSEQIKPYFGRSDRRIYTQINHVNQFLGHSHTSDLFEIHLLEPGFDEWVDITKDFVCEHHIGVCEVCEEEYDVDFEPPLFCHDDESWTVRLEHRLECRSHRRKT